MRLPTPSLSLAAAAFAQTVARVCSYIVEPGIMSEHEEKLIIDKFRGYNHLIRPVLRANSTPIIVNFGLAMILLINVDEKNQIMQTNVWLTLRWEDYQMTWNPKDYGGISTIRVPPDKVWVPDIVLFNNADGHYEVSFHSNVVIEYTGQMLWVPPAIYKSSCQIDVEFFPFDEQTCIMIFVSQASEDEERLIIDIFKGYNHLIRPVPNVTASSVEVSFSLAMILLINVDEKNQVMQTNVWLTMKWIDYQLRWDPRTYGNIQTIRVPPDKVWLPDIVLFNNADGNYEVSFYSNVVIEYTGQMLWVPPAIYKSSCTIDVEFFPFDEQTCAMIFGSWTFSKDEVTIAYLDSKRHVELNDYSFSGIWDIMEVPGELIHSKSKISYQIKIRRKTLFYTVILIIPTVLMAFLSMMVFYLPAEASEKITLAISILLALVVFLLLVSKILPPTSSTIPLMAKYLLLTFVMNIITILVTVVIINVYFRGPTTHRMPRWVRSIFLEQLPMFLLMKRPERTPDEEIDVPPAPTSPEKKKNRRKRTDSLLDVHTNNNNAIGLTPVAPGQFIEMSRAQVHHPYCSLERERQRLLVNNDGGAVVPSLHVRESVVEEDREPSDVIDWVEAQISSEALKAIEAIEYITEHLRQDDLYKKDEKDQVMQTNVWLTLKWYDFQMRWNPVNYGEIRQIRVSPDKVWLPDIVLFNNADGNYEVSFMSNVVINNMGGMLWVPPAIYKSSCIIDVEFFPFDEQTCHLIFGSWTYNENEIKLEFEQSEYVDLSEYSMSSIWDVIDAPASLVGKRSRIEYQVRIRRKTLFYTVVLIIPTVLMAFLSMAVFFLPADSGEKITLTISVLLSIVVFLLLVSKILPPTSSTIPLMAKYLLLTFVLNVITILVTVIIINVYFRGPTTHRMPRWVRRAFLDVMPKLLCMQRPKQAPRKYPGLNGTIAAALPGVGSAAAFTLDPRAHHPYCPGGDDGFGASRWQPPAIELHHVESVRELDRDPATSAFYPLSPDAVRAIDAIEYITDHLKQDEEYKMYRDDWKYVAMIIDRLLLYVFFAITLGGTCGILFSAPYVFHAVDQRAELKRLIDLYKAGVES